MIQLETTSRLTVQVEIPDGVHLAVPAMGTTPGQMTVSVVGPTEGECLRKLDKFMTNLYKAATLPGEER